MHATGDDDVGVVMAAIAKACEPPRSVAEVGPQDKLQDLGIDSLKFMLLVVEIEAELGRPVFSSDDMGQISGVGDLLRFLEA